MQAEQAKSLVEKTFTQAFDKLRFRNFVLELVNQMNEAKAQNWNVKYIKDAFKPHVNRYERLATYTSSEEEKLDILVVYLTEDYKLERTRTGLRDFVADYLKQRGEKDAALVAFVSPSEKQWRFSYVKMEYATVEKDSGNIGVETRLTPARRFSYIVGEEESCHTAQTRFLNLLKETKKNPTLADIEEAFSVEAVTKEFFKKYAELFNVIREKLDDLVAKNTSLKDEFSTKNVSTVDFSKKLMGQIVFLYFLQKKGWLGVDEGQEWGTGHRNFLRRLADGEYGACQNFFNDVLEPLFYDTLATDRGHEAWCGHFECRIPFLNGGLFEPLEGYDWQNIDIKLPNRLFFNKDFIEEHITGTGVLDVFDRYNFTVNEAEPLEKEVAIDPEMLGKVFENLIEENRRKGLGAYYTPREIVHYMCQESLINYLATSLQSTEEPIVPRKPEQGKLIGKKEPKQAILKSKKPIPREEIEILIHKGEQISHYESVERDYKLKMFKMPKSIRDNARLIDEKLAGITVCDPAVGSGAFLVGMMNEIVRARKALTPYFNVVEERKPYRLKHDAIQNSLYGVDIDPGAVEIAKLRLWLSLVVDEEAIKQIKPLPNLDYKVVAGNSLIGFPFKSEKLHAIEQLKQKFFDETDHDRKAKLKAEIDEQLQAVFASSKKSLGFEVNFDFHIYFSEVFHHNTGFDVVIVNPPYLGERGNKDIFRMIARSSLGKRFYKRKMDIFYFFFHLALDLAIQKASIGFITTNYWITADGAETLRSDFKKRATMLQLLSFGELKLFSEAKGQHDMITLLSKNDTNSVARTCITKRTGDATPTILRAILSSNDPETAYYTMEQSQLYEGTDNQVRLIPVSCIKSNSKAEVNTLDFEMIGKLSNQLKTYTKYVFRGVETGCDIVTNALIRAAIKKELINEEQADQFTIKSGIFVLSLQELNALDLTQFEIQQCVKPFYKNSEIERFYTPRKPKRYLLYVDSKTNIREYPNIKTHLQKFRPLLAAREQAVTAENNWFWIRGSKRESYEYRKDTIIVPYRSTCSRFSICYQDIYGAGDVYYISLKKQYSTKALLGYLNSKLVFHHLYVRGKRKGETIEYYKTPLEKIPVHKELLINPKVTKKFEEIVDKIIEQKKQNPDADITEWEGKIDELVYELYGLTGPEIDIVEGRAKKG